MSASDPWASYSSTPPTDPWAAYSSAPQSMPLSQAIPREAGIFGRAVGPTLAGAGAGAAIGALGGPADPVTVPAGAIIGGIVGSMPGGVMDTGVNWAANKMGWAQPQTSAEKTMSAIDQGVAGAMTGIGPGSAMKAAGKTVPEMAQYAAALLADKPVAQLGGAVGASALSSVAGQSGGGMGAQLGAGLLGGIAGHNAVSMPAGLLAAGHAILNPSAGIDRATGNLLYNNASDPSAAMSGMRRAPVYVSGSNPTASQSSLDPGLIGIEKGVRQLPQPGAAFTSILNDQNTARQNAFTGIAGTPETLQAMKENRDAVTGPMRDAAFNSYDSDPRLPKNQYQNFKAQVADSAENLPDNLHTQRGAKALSDYLGQYGYEVELQKSNSNKSSIFNATKMDPVTGEPISISFRTGNNPYPSNLNGNFIDLAHPEQGINALSKAIAQNEPTKPVVNPNYPLGVIKRTLVAPEGNRSQVRMALSGAIDDINGANNISDPRYAYEIKKDLATSAQKRLDTTGLDAGAKRLAAGITGSIADSFDNQINNATGGRYQPYLDQYSNMSKPIDRASLLQEMQQGASAQGMDIHGNRVLTQAGLGKQLQNNTADIANILTPEQQSSLNNIKSDLDRAQTANNVPGQAVGSDTIRNEMMANLLGKFSTLPNNKIVGLVPFGKTAASWANKGLDAVYGNPSMSRLSQALQNPSDAANLMSKTAAQQQQIKNAMMVRALYGNVAQPYISTMGSRQ